MTTPRVFVMLASIACALPATAHAQGAAGGALVGAGATYLTVPKGFSRKMDLGVTAGLFAILPITRMYKIQPEVQWATRKSQFVGTEREFDYLAVPLMVRMDLFKGLYIVEGPSYHIPLRATVESGGSKRDVKENVRDDISIVIGVGKRVGRLGIEGRWDSGIRQVQKTLEPGDDVPARNRSLALFLAFGVK